MADAVTQCTASSAEVEMIFSKAGMVCTVHRNRQKNDIIEALILLRTNEKMRLNLSALE